MDTIKQAKGFNYIEILPDDYQQGEQLPVIIHYHGHGWVQMGASDFYEKYTVLKDMRKFANEKRFAVIMPICYEDTWYDCFSELKNFTRSVLDMPFVDRSRVYCSGISMGGCAAWQMLCILIAKIMNARGKTVRTTFYEGVGHPCWELAYLENDLYDWLLSYRKE